MAVDRRPPLTDDQKDTLVEVHRMGHLIGERSVNMLKNDKLSASWLEQSLSNVDHLKGLLVDLEAQRKASVHRQEED